MFEYATLLNIKYGKQNNVSAEKDHEEDKNELKKCRKIDFYAFRAFIAIYFLTVVTYFYMYIYHLRE